MEFITTVICYLVQYCFGISIAIIGVLAAQWIFWQLYAVITNKPATEEDRIGIIERIFYACALIALGIPFLFICFTTAGIVFGLIPLSI